LLKYTICVVYHKHGSGTSGLCECSFSCEVTCASYAESCWSR